MDAGAPPATTILHLFLFLALMPFDGSAALPPPQPGLGRCFAPFPHSLSVQMTPQLGGGPTLLPSASEV